MRGDALTAARLRGLRLARGCGHRGATHRSRAQRAVAFAPVRSLARHAPRSRTLLRAPVSRIALVKPDKARGVENMLISMAQRGQISEPVRRKDALRAARRVRS
jgi:DNA-binding TFAR19-related protein (PDSD5 family)